jgi:hypothetical protein
MDAERQPAHNSVPNFSMEDKRVAVELWKAKVPLKRIREQLKMSKATLKRVLAHAKANPLDPVKKRKIGSGMNQGKVTEDTLRVMKTHLSKTPTLTARSLKRLVPGLANTSIRQIQDICLKRLNLPSRKMASKPVLTDKMREKRLAFAHQYGHWTVDDWKKVMFSDESHFELQFSRQVRCRRPQGSDRFSPHFTRKTVKHPAGMATPPSTRQRTSTPTSPFQG